MTRTALRSALRAGVIAGAVVMAATLASCGGEAVSSPSPLPSLTSSAGPASASPGAGQAWAGLVGYEEIRFRGRAGEARPAGQDIVLRVVRAQWRRAVVAEDGSVHEDVLAVALRVTCPSGAGSPLDLRDGGLLTLSDGRHRRSGRFAVAGQLGVVAPGEAGQGWLVFENVDWDALRGSTQPPVSRFQVDVPSGDGSAVGTAVWMVDAFGLQEGDVRRVTLAVLSASVGYLVL